jgi:hypothetical protein
MRLKLSALLFAVSALSAAAIPRLEPDVVFSGDRIVGLPAQGHRVLSQKMDLLEAEGCSAEASGASVHVPENCGFLRGLYSYTFAGEEGKHREIVFEFDLTRHAKGHVFMLAAPIEVPAL